MTRKGKENRSICLPVVRIYLLIDAFLSSIRKNEVIREVELETTKKKQQKSHLEEDLDNILADADLEQYRKLGNLLKSYE